MPLIYLQAGACMQMENINKTLFSICFSCFIRNIVIAIFLKYHDTILGYIQVALHVWFSITMRAIHADTIVKNVLMHVSRFKKKIRVQNSCEFGQKK